jgi:hypothetical protein
VRLKDIDRLIFVWLYRFFPSILNAITVIKPETVIRWHRRGFRAYWRWKSRRCGGRPQARRRDPLSHPTDEIGKPTAGRVADTRRTDARDRGRRLNGGELPDQEV